MKYLFWLIVLICIVHCLTVHALPSSELERRKKTCKSDADCGGKPCDTKEGLCETAYIDCCWMPPIYCCGD
ncbi:7584_t:CDS:2 [Dentiscutata erythropus]|uniref:7584_t:CDS:1 n=1 Tax=Dentiscutata erythropus TaxID=1348616 RepID=A0A9N9CGE1_9GLOM|nr:7584_t:CDS:2 [Dentiscutata erythropus]